VGPLILGFALAAFVRRLSCGRASDSSSMVTTPPTEDAGHRIPVWARLIPPAPMRDSRPGPIRSSARGQAHRAMALEIASFHHLVYEAGAFHPRPAHRLGSHRGELWAGRSMIVDAGVGLFGLFPRQAT